MFQGQQTGILSTTLSLQTRLADKNPLETVRSIAALQLVPANAFAQLRFEVLAHVAASIDPEDTSNELPRDELEEICNQGPIEGVFPLEDPFVNYFTEGVCFPRGEAIAFPGIVEQTAYIHTRFLESLKTLSNGSLSSDLVLEESQLLQTACLFSTRVARRAGLERNQLPENRQRGGEVTVPASEDIERLKDAATIPKARWNMVARQLGLDPQVIERLTTGTPVVDLVNYNLSSGELNRSPIVDIGDAYCAPLPSMLLPTARHSVILNLLEDGHRDAFAEAFTKSVWNNLRLSLERLEHRQLAFELPEPDSFPTTYREGVFQFDTDKVIYVLLVTDDLTDYEPDTPFGVTPTEDIPQFVQTRLREASDAWQADGGREGSLSFLLVHQGVGRTFVSGFNPPGHPVLDTGLLLSAADLEILSILEVGQQLFLWKHAKAVDQLMETTRVEHTDYLDVIGLYRDNGNSFYVSDEEKPDTLYVPPGHKWSLVEELWERHNPHWAPSWDRYRSERVVNRYDKREVPIYFPLHGPRDRAPHLVEGLPRSVWVLAARQTNSEETQILSTLADAIAYWVWQVTPYLVNLEGWSHLPHSTLNIEVDIEDPHAWRDWMKGDAGSTGEPGAETAPTLHINREDTTLYVGLPAGVVKELKRPDNEGERTLIKHLLPPLRSLIDEDAPAWDETRIQQIIDDVAPRGLKKKILLLNMRSSPAMRGGDLPHWRPVSDADKERLLDGFGTYLVREGFTEGPIPEAARQNALNEIVEWLYQRLQDRCAQLSPDGLLEFVLAHHEALVQARAEHELLLPTRRVCFGQSEEMLEAMKEEHLDFTKAGIATRFLVEYLAAKPPSGDEPISVATYDELVAVCSLIADLGFESDFLEFGLTDHEIHVLPSGRIGRPDQPVQEAVHRFSNLFVPYEVERQAGSFPGYWSDSEDPGEKPDFIEDFDQAAEQEFGLTITDQLLLMVEAINIAEEQASELAMMGMEAFIDRLEEETGLARDTVERGVDLLSLEVREDFLTPPDPFEEREVWPWVFNRRLSFIRRPFILRESGDETEILWGERHTWVSLQNLQALCSSGRLPCESDDLRELIGEMNDRRGREYNAFVGRTVEKETDLPVEVNWDAQGQLAEDGDPLGDIDVLIPDPEEATLFAVECKRLARGRTPRELDNEIGKLFGQTGEEDDVEAGDGTIDKHLRRIEWMREHIDSVISILDLNPNRAWSVEPVLLLDKPMLSIFLSESPIPVVIGDQIQEAPMTRLRDAVSSA